MPQPWIHKATFHERAYALTTLLQLEDRRLETLAASVENDGAVWPDAIARHVTIKLFPRHLSVQSLLAILRRVKDNPKHIVTGFTDCRARLRAWISQTTILIGCVRDWRIWWSTACHGSVTSFRI